MQDSLYQVMVAATVIEKFCIYSGCNVILFKAVVTLYEVSSVGRQYCYTL